MLNVAQSLQMEHAQVMGCHFERVRRVDYLFPRFGRVRVYIVVLEQFAEMKMTRQQLERGLAVPDGYDSFFSFPSHKGGYSGVAVYTKRSDAIPIKAEEGLSARLQPKPPLSNEERISGRYPDVSDLILEPNDDGRVPQDVIELDCEGRALVLDFGLFVLINLYCPAETTEARTPFKVHVVRSNSGRT